VVVDLPVGLLNLDELDDVEPPDGASEPDEPTQEA